MRYFIVGGDALIDRMMTGRGHQSTTSIEVADVVIFTGGADVTPSLYDKPAHFTTCNDPARDRREERIYDNLDIDQLTVGICRGGQFLNVMNDGSMYQDVDKHAISGTHDLVYKGIDKDYLIPVTSTHHQMMKPSKEGVVWGTATLTTRRADGVSTWYNINHDTDPDIEIVWYPETRCLCFQPHPEYSVKECEKLFFDCLYRAQSEGA